MLDIIINIAEQKLYVLENRQVKKIYAIASSKYGVGQEEGSYKTPLGLHEICEKIGAACSINTIFSGRKPTGETYSEELALKNPDKDFILTRILWLKGLEPENANTKNRYIYIHGTPDQIKMGSPSSHGCIRMRNQDIIELFDAVDIGTQVRIGENK